jgi:hypothetical protein
VNRPTSWSRAELIVSLLQNSTADAASSALSDFIAVVSGSFRTQGTRSSLAALGGIFRHVDSLRGTALDPVAVLSRPLTNLQGALQPIRASEAVDPDARAARMALYAAERLIDAPAGPAGVALTLSNSPITLRP